jgi:kynureninase
MNLQEREVQARRLDEQDDLARFRACFHLPPGKIYLDGNSLGPLSAPAERAVLRVLEEWKTCGIAGWMEASPPWLTAAEEASRLMAPLVGAEAEEVLVANSTTVNLHQLLATLYQPAGRRVRLLADELAFPTDAYALHSHLRLRGRDPQTDLVRVPSRDGLTLAEQDIADAMTEAIALAVLPSVVYTSGQLLDVAWLTRQAHARGVLIGFDCSHSVGAVPHAFDDWDVDFAFWCSYKYLNGGPGGVGCLYLNRRHFGRPPGLAGWFGCRRERQFDMAPDFDPAPDARALHVGTPHLLSLAPLLATLETVREAGIERLRAKSLRLTAFLIELAEAELGGDGVTVATPREDSRRGGHVALVHPEAPRVCQALKDAGVVADHRPPHIVRLAPAALYNTFGDCCAAVARLKVIMEGRTYEGYPARRPLVP